MYVTLPGIYAQAEAIDFKIQYYRKLMDSVTAIAHPNIAFIKYWGNREDEFRIPSNGSISMNLSSLETRTSISLDAGLPADQITINGEIAKERDAERIRNFLEIIRRQSGISTYARLSTSNNFPTGSGIASSASGFAALALAGSKAYGLSLNEPALSRLARKGSGSACRSIPAGFVEWLPGKDDTDSFAVSLASPDHWQLVDLVAIVNAGQKKISSTEGHHLASTSPLQSARVMDTDRRLTICREAIMERDLNLLAVIVEQDCLMMHAVMMTSSPALMYWLPATLEVIQAVVHIRSEGIPAFYTIDAGANVHVLTTIEFVPDIEVKLRAIASVSTVLISPAGGPARLVTSDLKF